MEDKDSKGGAKKPDDAPPQRDSATETPVPSIRAVPKAIMSKIERRVRWACIGSLVALGLIVWSVVQPRPIPVIVAMSVGQAVGTLAFLLFLGSIALDIRARYRLSKRTPPKSRSGAE